MSADDNLLDQTIVPAFKDFEKAIEFCANEGLGTQALILTFSAIDFAGWLDSQDDQRSRDSFEKWVSNYMLPHRELGCTATELWGARCGLLHTYAPGSRASREGEVRELLYSWGNDQAAKLQGYIDTHSKGYKALAVQGQALIEAFQAGLTKFLKEIGDDPTRLNLVREKASKILKTLSQEDREMLFYRQELLFATLLR